MTKPVKDTDFDLSVSRAHASLRAVYEQVAYSRILSAQDRESREREIHALREIFEAGVPLLEPPPQEIPILAPSLDLLFALHRALPEYASLIESLAEASGEALVEFAEGAKNGGSRVTIRRVDVASLAHPSLGHDDYRSLLAYLATLLTKDELALTRKKVGIGGLHLIRKTLEQGNPRVLSEVLSFRPLLHRSILRASEVRELLPPTFRHEIDQLLPLLTVEFALKGQTS